VGERLISTRREMAAVDSGATEGYVWGGRKPESMAYEPLQKVYLEKDRVLRQPVQTHGPAPRPCSGATLCRVQHWLIFFGGYNI
jgi:hypothetical protein